MNKPGIFAIILCCVFGVSACAAEVTDSAETVGYEVLSGYGLGSAVGLSGHLIFKDSDSGWMPRSFAYVFPAGAAAGVLLAGEIKGEASTNRMLCVSVTLVSAYIPILIGELLSPGDGRALGVLFSAPAAAAAYNYVKEVPDDGAEKAFSLSFSFDI